MLVSAGSLCFSMKEASRAAALNTVEEVIASAPGAWLDSTSQIPTPLWST